MLAKSLFGGRWKPMETSFVDAENIAKVKQ